MAKLEKQEVQLDLIQEVSQDQITTVSIRFHKYTIKWK